MNGARGWWGWMVVLAALAGAVGTGSPAHGQGTIKVGALIPLTGGGATVGESGQIAVELAVRNINAAGGIAGRRIQLVIGDYQTDATVGVSEAKRLIHQEKIELLVGPTYSQVTLAVMPLLIEAKIPSINVSGSERLTPDVAPYAFSMLANPEAQSKVMVDYAVTALKARSAAMLRPTQCGWPGRWSHVPILVMSPRRAFFRPRVRRNSASQRPASTSASVSLSVSSRLAR